MALLCVLFKNEIGKQIETKKKAIKHKNKPRGVMVR